MPMADQIKIRHPEAGTAMVPASAVPHWVRAGWVPVEEEPKPTPGKPRRRRANSEEEN